MGGLALAFHLVSLVVFLLLGVRIARLSATLKTWRDWNAPGSHQRVVVGEPIRVLRSFAAAVGAEFEADVPDNALAPVRVSLHSLFILHGSGFVERIAVKNAPVLRVCFFLRYKPGTIGVDPELMGRELGSKLVVEWFPPDEPA